MVIDFEKNMIHKVSEVICIKCKKRFISTRPIKTKLKQLECPKCHNIGYIIETGEILDE